MSLPETITRPAEDATLQSSPKVSFCDPTPRLPFRTDVNQPRPERIPQRSHVNGVTNPSKLDFQKFL